MNTTRAKKRLIKATENKTRLKYPDETEVQNNDTILVYGERWDRGKTVEWKCEAIRKASLASTADMSLPDQPGQQQLLLKATVGIENSNYGQDYTLTNVEKIDHSPIDKPKDKIKNIMVNLWRLGWPTKYLYGDTVVDIDETSWQDNEFESVTVDDFKITTVRGRNKAMHLGRGGINTDYAFELGVNWYSWHRKDATSRFKTLTHEMVHCYHAHHRASFFEEHARVVSAIADSDGRRNRANNLFDGDINWSEVKAKTLDGVHSQPKEINIGSHPHRRAACNAVVDDLEDILNYKYETGRVLHLHPPTDALKPDWIFEFDPDEGEEWPAYEELQPDNIDRVNINTISISDNYTDEELVNALKALKRDDSHSFKYVFAPSDLPVVDSDGNIVKNEVFAALYKQMHEAKHDNKPVIDDHGDEPTIMLYINTQSASMVSKTV